MLMLLISFNILCNVNLLLFKSDIIRFVSSNFILRSVMYSPILDGLESSESLSMLTKLLVYLD